MDDKFNQGEPAVKQDTSIAELRHEFDLKLTKLESRLAELEAQFSMLWLWGGVIVVVALGILELLKPLTQP